MKRTHDFKDMKEGDYYIKPKDKHIIYMEKIDEKRNRVIIKVYFIDNFKFKDRIIHSYMEMVVWFKNDDERYILNDEERKNMNNTLMLVEL